MWARDERFTESAMSSGGVSDVSTAWKEGRAFRKVRAGWDERGCAYQAVQLHTSTEFPREPPRATPAIAEAPVICVAHIAAPLPLLCVIINQAATVKIPIIIILCGLPWEWEVSADLFIRHVACKCSAASADECRQTQRSDRSPRRFVI
jgi:hypothetical protein